MQGFITRINDIDIRLVAPSGTEIILLDYINYCNLEDDWNHGIEDGGLNLNGLPCPPTDGLIYDPETLSQPLTMSLQQATGIYASLILSMEGPQRLMNGPLRFVRLIPAEHP